MSNTIQYQDSQISEDATGSKYDISQLCHPCAGTSQTEKFARFKEIISNANKDK